MKLVKRDPRLRLISAYSIGFDSAQSQDATQVAVLISGQPRYVHLRLCSDALNRHLLTPNRAKIFGHLWAVAEHPSNLPTSTWAHFKSDPFTPDARELALRKFPWQEIQFEEPVNFTPRAQELRRILALRFPNHPVVADVTNVVAMLSQFHSLSRAYKLFLEYERAGEMFDWIATTRTDLYMKSDVILAGMPEGCVTTSHHEYFPDVLLAYSRRYAEAIDIIDDVEDLAKRVRDPAAESFRREALLRVNSHATVFVLDIPSFIYRGESRLGLTLRPVLYWLSRLFIKLKDLL